MSLSIGSDLALESTALSFHCWKRSEFTINSWTVWKIKQLKDKEKAGLPIRRVVASIAKGGNVLIVAVLAAVKFGQCNKKCGASS